MTRTCPICSTTYEEGVFFCGADGAIVIEDQDGSDFDSRLGRQLGGYIVAARVADGAMGRVFEGRHPETKARVAIKVLHDEVAKDPISVERFKREYETAGELDHPHVVNVLEFGETDEGSYFMTMEYLEGTELGQLTGKGEIQPAARTVRVICQTALALDSAHSFGFIHRDLKPDNIFLCATEDGDSVRILDFGSVKLQVEMGAKLTAVGTTLGSPYYMSPEQATGAADVDQRTDVFALGAILYEMLTDKVAFDGANVAMILMKIMNDTPAPPSGINPDCPASVDDVVDKAIRKDKARRYASATELAAALLQGYGLEGSVEQWANTPQKEIEAALAAATPAAPKPFGQSEPPPAAPRGPAAAPAPAKDARPLPTGSQPNPVASAPDQAAGPERESELQVAGVGGGNGPAIAIIAAVAVAVGVLVYLLR